MGAWHFRNSMPDEMCAVQVFQVLAIDVDLKRVGQVREPFDNRPFGAEALPEKWGDDSQSMFLLGFAHAFGSGRCLLTKTLGPRLFPAN